MLGTSIVNTSTQGSEGRKMRKFNLFGLSTIAIIAAALSGCSNSDSPTEQSMGTAQMKLSTTGDNTGYCVTGDIVFTSTTNSNVYTVSNPNCSNVAPIEIILLPDTYTVSIPNPVCTPPAASSSNYTGCTFSGTTPTPVVVAVGQTAPVAINMQYYYDTTIEEVVFGVGSASVTLGSPTAVELCGSAITDPVCGTGEACYILSPATGPACYANTCPTTACASGQTCIPVALPSQIGQVGSLAALPHICTPALPGRSAATGTGGATGVGGASSTGGSSAAGGTSAVAGATSVGGTTATAGSTNT